MSKIVACPTCGHVTETFRPSARRCNHNQDEEGTPVPTSVMYPVDPIQATYVKAWLSYHEAARDIDGYILVPQDAQEVALQRQAIRAGIDAQVAVMRAHNTPVPADGAMERRQWNAANKIAMRILGLPEDP